MGDCPAERFAADVIRPTFVLRPRSEMELEHVQVQTAEFGVVGFQIHVADPGVHGSSLLDPARVDGDVEPTWAAVLEFLGELSASRER